MRRIASLTFATALVGVALGTATAHASLRAPSDGSTVEGLVTIEEDRGAVRDNFCSAFGSASSTITVTRLSDNVVVHQGTKPAPGSWSTIWDSRNEIEDGAYRIRSTAQDRTISSFCFNSPKTLSTITVELRNYRTYIDDGGLGSIAINPYLQRFRVRTTDGYDSGSRIDPSMRFVGVPALATPAACDPTTDPKPCVPSAPAVAAWCTDPTNAAFLPRLLLEGPQGCVPGTVPSPPTPPGPPNPPPPPPVDPNDPPEPPTADPSVACATPATSGCPSSLIAVTYTAEDLTLTGIFDRTALTFASLTITPATTTAYPMRHLP